MNFVIKLKFDLVGYYSPIDNKYKRNREDFIFRESKLPDHFIWLVVKLDTTEFEFAESLTYSHRTILNQFLPKELTNIILHYNPILCPIYTGTTVKTTYYSTFENSIKYKHNKYHQNSNYTIPHFIPYINFEEIITKDLKVQPAESLGIFDYLKLSNNLGSTLFTYYKCIDIDQEQNATLDSI